MHTLPLSDTAVQAFQAALGSAHVRVADAAGSHADPYAFDAASACSSAAAGAAAARFIPAAAVLPASVAELQAILAIAREHRIPLWTVSTGKNLGYGGAAPRVAGSVVVDLQRMNRVLEVNEELGYAVVEPGVRFLDLHAHLRANGHKLMMSVPDIGWGSLVGNALERGFGYAENWDHGGSHCGLEVVLADGRVLRTGMGAKGANGAGSASGANRTNGADGANGANGATAEASGASSQSAWHVYKGGFGPSIDGLLQQSNLGIVTRMGVWLRPQPQTVVACMVKVPRSSDLGALVDTLRPLLLDGTVQSNAVIGNATVIASMISERGRWHSGDGAMPEAAVQAMAQGLQLGRWNARFGLYGPETMTAARLAIVRAAVAKIPGAELVARSYPGDVAPQDAHPADHAQLGIPSTALLRMAAWRGGTPAHTDFSLVCPATAACVEQQLALIQPEIEAAGFDYAGGFTLCGRHAIALALLAFDRADAQMPARVEALMGRLIDRASQAGWAPYRAHVAFMDRIAAQYNFNDHALRGLLQSIKQTLDPLGILSPGKQGVWPLDMSTTSL